MKSVSNKRQWLPSIREPDEPDTYYSLADRYANTGLPKHLLNRLQQQMRHIGIQAK